MKILIFIFFGLISYSCTYAQSILDSNILKHETEIYNNNLVINYEVGLIEELYASGNKYKLHSSTIESKKNGTTLEWFENGVIKSINNFLYGQKYGKSIKFYHNGVVREEGFYYVQMDDSLKNSILIKINLIEHIDTSYGLYSNPKIIIPKDSVDFYDEKDITFPDYIFWKEIVHLKNKKWSYYSLNGELIKEETWDKGELIETKEY